MGKLRPIAPISLAAGPTSPAIVPARKLGTKPEITWVDPRTLMVEEAYQRELSARSVALIRRIVANWSWAHVKPPIVARGDDGQRCIIDGQHTAIAAVSHGGIDKIPVLFVDADAVEARASAFLAHNRDRVFLTPMAIHHAALAAGQADAKAIDEACRKGGVRIAKTMKPKWDVGDSLAIGAIHELVAARSTGEAARILKILVAAKRAPVAAQEIKALGLLLPRGALPEEYARAGAVVASETRETWERLAHSIAKERKILVWRALADLWRAQLEGKVVTRGDQARPAAGAEGVSARDPHTRSDPVRGRATPAAGPARESAAGAEPAKPAGDASAPAGSSPPRKTNGGASLIRNDRIERDVLDAIERGPTAGLDVATLQAKTSWPANNIRNALAALAHDKVIAPRGLRYVLRGVEE